MFKILGLLLTLGLCVGVMLLWARPATGVAWLIVLAPLALVWWALSLFFDK